MEGRVPRHWCRFQPLTVAPIGLAVAARSHRNRADRPMRAGLQQRLRSRLDGTRPGCPPLANASLTVRGNLLEAVGIQRAPSRGTEHVVTDIDKAREIREVVLASDEDVTRVTRVSAGAEYPCWAVKGQGWYAEVTNLWDLNVATSRVRGESPNEVENVIHHELLELWIDGIEESVMSYCYGNEHDEEHLFEYREGAWERLFDPSVRSAPDLRKAA